MAYKIRASRPSLHEGLEYDTRVADEHTSSHERFISHIAASCLRRSFPYQRHIGTNAD